MVFLNDESSIESFERSMTKPVVNNTSRRIVPDENTAVQLAASSLNTGDLTTHKDGSSFQVCTEKSYVGEHTGSKVTVKRCQFFKIEDTQVAHAGEE